MNMTGPTFDGGVVEIKKLFTFQPRDAAIVRCAFSTGRIFCKVLFMKAHSIEKRFFLLLQL